MSSLRTWIRLDRWKHSILWLLAVFLVGIETYRHTIGYWFVATDSLALIERSRVQSMTDFVQIFTQPLMHGSGFTDVALFYRPLSSLSYAVEYPLWGACVLD